MTTICNESKFSSADKAALLARVMWGQQVGDLAIPDDMLQELASLLKGSAKLWKMIPAQEKKTLEAFLR